MISFLRFDAVPRQRGLVLLLLAGIGAAQVQSAHARYPDDFSEPLEVIAFGSCNLQGKAQPHWSTIRQHNPDLWIWLGDTIYADTTNMTTMAEKYDQQFHHRDYTPFRKAVDIVGTWDDHDYGQNNAGRTYPQRERSQELLLDFLEVPESSPRRERDGVYGVYRFGPPEKRVVVLLLDNRYHAEEAAPDATLLGEKQWRFLENELEQSEAPLVLICSGIQILPKDHRFEKWADYPKARERLFQTLARHKTEGVLLLSGDRHIQEISLLNDKRVPYPLLEITSSGLTHSYEKLEQEPNRFRVGPIHTEKGFALLQIDWDRDPVRIRIEIRNLDDQIVNQFILPASALRPSKDGAASAQGKTD